MNQKEELHSILTQDFMKKEVLEIIDEILAYPDSRNDEKVHIDITVGDLKRLKGFHGSADMVHELLNAYVGRFMHFYVMKNRVEPQLIMEFFTEIDPIQEKASEEAVKVLVKKLGPVTPERVKEIDEMVQGMRQKAVTILQELSKTGKVPDVQTKN